MATLCLVNLGLSLLLHLLVDSRILSLMEALSFQAQQESAQLYSLMENLGEVMKHVTFMEPINLDKVSKFISPRAHHYFTWKKNPKTPPKKNILAYVAWPSGSLAFQD